MIRLTALFLVIPAFAASLAAQQKQEITDRYFFDPDIVFNTPTLSIDEDRFASYEEIIDWITVHLSGHPDVIVEYIGTTPDGYDIPIIYLRKQGVSPDLKVWMQGLLHGNEPGGTEGLFFLATQILSDEHMNEWLEHISLAILPIANIDGYLNMQRRSSGGLDLNRDQTKFADPVSRIIRQAFTDWAPDIAFDFHEYQPTRNAYAGLGENGASIAYDLLFLPSGHLNIPEEIRKGNVEVFQKEAERLLDKHGYSHAFYFSADTSGDELILNKGARSPQSSSSSFALSNAFSMLIETRGIGIGRTSLARRTHSAYLAAYAGLQSAVKQKEYLFELLDAARSSTLDLSQDIIVTSQPSEKYYLLRFIDLETSEIIVEQIKTRDALDMTPMITRSKPFGYIIEDCTQREKEILQLLGLEIQPLKRGRYEVESFAVTAFEEAENTWEGIHVLEVETDVFRQRKRFGKGAYYISLSQKNANYAMTLLEPESNNGFISFRVSPASPDSVLKIHRLVEMK